MNVLYNVHEFQTWSNDLKRRGPGRIKRFAMFPPTCLSPSSQCPKKHLNSHLLWKKKRGRDSTSPCFLCCRAAALSDPPAQEKPLACLIGWTHAGVRSRREPEATWNRGLRSLEEGDDRKAIAAQAELMTIWKYKRRTCLDSRSV